MLMGMNKVKIPFLTSASLHGSLLIKVVMLQNECLNCSCHFYLPNKIKTTETFIEDKNDSAAGQNERKITLGKTSMFLKNGYMKRKL